MLLLSVLLIPESYWCTPIDPGSREIACGYGYARTEVKNAVILLWIFGSCAFIVTAWNALHRRLSAWGLCGLVFSAVLVGLMMFLKVHYGVEDSP